MTASAISACGPPTLLHPPTPTTTSPLLSRQTFYIWYSLCSLYQCKENGSREAKMSPARRGRRSGSPPKKRSYPYATICKHQPPHGLQHLHHPYTPYRNRTRAAPQSQRRLDPPLAVPLHRPPFYPYRTLYPLSPSRRKPMALFPFIFYASTANWRELLAGWGRMGPKPENGGRGVSRWCNPLVQRDLRIPGRGYIQVCNCR